MTETLPATPEGIARAVELLHAGEVVAFPTDTVYGVGVAASRRDRLPALFELKARPVDRRIPLLVTDLAQATREGWEADERVETLARRFWPGALTIVLPWCSEAPADAELGETQAFRSPNHPVALALIREAGPIYATSANVSDEPDTLGADEVLIAFATRQDGLAAVVDGGAVPGGVASTVIDLSVEPARLLRPGPITIDQLAAVVEVASGTG
jgi:L-threonylcarbamoyladenylate synthase